MIDISRHPIDIQCEKCNFKNTVTLKQAKANTIIICRGCKVNIQLIDHMYSVRKSIKSINREISSLMEEFDKLSNINLKF